jgi:hypothetical protein
MRPLADIATLAVMRHYIVTIEGPNFDDVEEIELPTPPDDGELVDTKYGTCVVTAVEQLPDGHRFDGRIVCRFP